MSADLHHLAAAYALDALDDVERREFERHYPSCDICSAEVAEFREVAAALAASASTEAPAEIKSSVMSQISQTRQVSPLVSATTTPAATARTSGGFPRRMLFAAAAALLVLGGVVVATLPDSNTDRTTEVVDSLDAVVTSLDPLTGLDGNLRIIWSDDLDKVVIVGSQLDDPGVDKAYALWFLVDDGVVPAGLFRPDAGSVNEVLDIDDLDTNGWGITIEPAEGSAQPTTEVIFAGTI